MDQQQINTIIVLRNDQTTNWESSEVVMLPGEVGIGYLENNNVIAKLGDGVHTWKDLPQIEGVFEEDVTLTYDFGRHKTSNGYVVTEAKGKTTSQWLLDALSEILNPTVNYPSVSLTCGALIEGATKTASSCEIGSNITALQWDGTFGAGSYTDAAGEGTYGTVESKTSNATGLTTSNVTWSVSNSVDAQSATSEDGKFTLTSDKYIQVTSESATDYAQVTATATLDATGARTPLNNVGSAYADGKIAGFDKEGTTVNTVTASCSVTGYRKPFWGVSTASIDVNDITSEQVRALGNSGTKTKGLPTTLSVPEGSKQVIFCAKAGTYSSLLATDAAAQNAVVTFTKKANAVSVNGANGFEAAAYDMWSVTWGDPIASAKSLNLAWS